MPYRTPRPSILRAARGNRELARGFTSLDQRLSRIEQATSHSASSPTRQRPLVSVPPSSRLQVTAASGTGRFQVGITLPQFLSPRAGKQSNQIQAAIWHEISYSSSPTFRQGVTTVLPPTTSTSLPVIQNAGSKLYFRIRSSFDGRTWGSYIRSGLVNG